MNPQESAIATGNIAYSVNSFSDLGSDTFKGILNYKGNHYGMHQFDLNVSGPLAKGWTYALNMYQNFDPGTFDLKFTNYNDRTQIYKGARQSIGETEVSCLSSTSSQTVSVWVP